MSANKRRKDRRRIERKRKRKYEKSGQEPLRDVSVICQSYDPKTCDRSGIQVCPFSYPFHILLPVGEGSVQLGFCPIVGQDPGCVIIQSKD